MTSQTRFGLLPPASGARRSPTAIGAADRVARPLAGVPPGTVVATVAVTAAAGILWPASVTVPVFVGLMGAMVVGPLVAHAVSWWIGWRVVLPLVLGGVPSSRAVRGARARCSGCGRGLSPRGLPAICWTIRAGRCGSCRTPVPGWVGAVEWSTGVLFTFCAARVGWSWTLGPMLVFAAGAVAACAVDVEFSRIPTRIVIGTAALCLALMSAASFATGTGQSLVAAIAGSGAAGGLVLLLHVLSPAGLGMGDVRLAGLVGLVSGWTSWVPGDKVAGPISAAFAALLVACVVALASHGITALRHGAGGPLPFAPALTIGALAVVMWSPS
jgi:leader peptidase (prepilin peptidase) / N-methyltransferase